MGKKCGKESKNIFIIYPFKNSASQKKKKLHLDCRLKD